MSSHEGYKLGEKAKDKAGRLKKAEKIVNVIDKHKKLKGKRVLDIGTGAGYISHVLSRHAKKVDSVDIVDDRLIKDGYTQTLVSDETLPFKDKTFDVVVTNHVLEHVPDQTRHLREIRRVLKDDGLVYLASPNKWWLTDPHYNLPFISWLPRSASDKYLKLVKNRKWDIYSVSLSRLYRLAAQEGFNVTDKVWDVILEPKEYNMNIPKLITSVAKNTPPVVSRLLIHVVPTHVKILTPKNKSGQVLTEFLDASGNQQKQHVNRRRPKPAENGDD